MYRGKRGSAGSGTVTAWPEMKLKFGASASLFPGLDGFTRSLYHELRLMSER